MNPPPNRRPETHIYRGVRVFSQRPGNGRHVVGCLVGVDGRPLPATKLADEQSPGGYDWGYHGDGPAALAHSILEWEFDEAIANELYREFECEVVAMLPVGAGGTEWVLTSKQIRAWLEGRHQSTPESSSSVVAGDSQTRRLSPAALAAEERKSLTATRRLSLSSLHGEHAPKGHQTQRLTPGLLDQPPADTGHTRRLAAALLHEDIEATIRQP